MLSAENDNKAFDIANTLLLQPSIKSPTMQCVKGLASDRECISLVRTGATYIDVTIRLQLQWLCIGLAIAKYLNFWLNFK